MKKRIFIITLILILTLSACQKAEVQEEQEEVSYAGTGVISLQMRDPDTLDVLSTKKQSVRDALLTVYEPLFNITEEFSLEGVLAEEYAFNENCTALTVKLKEGVLWHNNRMFSADDVIYTTQKIKENTQSSYHLNLEKVDNVLKINDYEVVFYLTEPCSLFVYNLYFPIVQFNAEPESLIGTGPYTLLENDGKQLTLTVNFAWHRGRAKNDGVRFIYLRTSDMAQEAFSSGKIHAVTNSVIDTENFAIKKSNKKYTCPNGLFEFMGFNTTQGIFKDANMRRAASCALDRDSISEIYDSSVASPFPVMNGSGDFKPIYEAVDYSSEGAMEIIFSSGWRDNDGDKVFERVVDGKEEQLSVSLIVSNQDALRVRTAEKIKEQLSLAGFEVKLEKINITEFNTRIAGGDFDMFLGAVYYNSPYDMSELICTGGRVNYTGWSDKETDEAVNLFLSSPDTDTQTVAFSKMQSIFNSKQPITGLVFRSGFVVTSSAIEGEVKPYPFSPYVNVHEWTIK